MGAFKAAEKNMVFAARLTQRGHVIATMDELFALYEKSFTEDTLKNIGQRSCRRNTDEMRIVMLKIWQDLYLLSPSLFAPELTGPFCQRDKCSEGKMSCGKRIGKELTPSDILAEDYPAIGKEAAYENKAH